MRLEQIKLPGEEKRFQPDICPACYQPLEWHTDFITGKSFQECTCCDYTTQKEFEDFKN